MEEGRWLAGYANHWMEHAHDESLPFWHQLIIIGNGFDLECGLRSSYVDFETPRQRIIKREGQEDSEVSKWVRGLLAQGITVWDVILEWRRGDAWFNIEQAIDLCVSEVIKYCDPDKNAAGGISMKRVVREICEGGGRVYGNVGEQPESLEWLVKMMIIECSNEGTWSEDKVLKVLLDQLCKLEDQFNEYLFGQMCHNKAYFMKADKLMHQILEREKPNDSYGNVCSSVLNFNYTDPTGLGDNHEQYITDAVINIHGRLGEGTVLFGVESPDGACDSRMLPFTKTYRVLFQQRETITSLFRVPDEMSRNGYVNGTDVIKFYGHSLSSYDYPYFQSIFDGVNLYASNTKLIFYYRSPRIDNKTRLDESVTRSKMVTAVYKLIETYGLTLNNVDHGNNLLNKLIIEGRLAVTKLDD